MPARIQSAFDGQFVTLALGSVVLQTAEGAPLYLRFWSTRTAAGRHSAAVSSAPAVRPAFIPTTEWGTPIVKLVVSRSGVNAAG